MNIHDSGVQLKYIRDRMLHSALNFAIGFFGLPIEGKYLQSVTIEEDGVCLTNHFLVSFDLTELDSSTTTRLLHIRPARTQRSRRKETERYIS